MGAYDELVGRLEGRAQDFGNGADTRGEPADDGMLLADAAAAIRALEAKLAVAREALIAVRVCASHRHRMAYGAWLSGSYVPAIEAVNKALASLDTEKADE